MWRGPVPSQWGTMTHPEGALIPFNPLTPCITVHIYTFVYKLDAGVHGYQTNKRPRSCLIRGRVLPSVLGNHILP